MICVQLNLVEKGAHAVMLMDELLKGIKFAQPESHDPSMLIQGIQFNSRKIRPGDLFVAINGFSADGHRYINQAIANGAAAVVGEQNVYGLNVPYYQTSDSRKALARLASNFYGHPSKNHIMIGITGTNGKTTTAYLLKHIIEQSGITCSMIGTVNNMINNQAIQSKNTTPDPLELQSLLAESRDEVVIMEVSSHGIEQQRVEGILFDYTLFTNLGNDHLDYHESLEAYFNVKARLFKRMKSQGTAIIASHNEWGKKLQKRLSESGHNVLTFGKQSEDEMQLLNVCTEYFPTIKVRLGDTTDFLQIPLPGMHNVWNTLGALLTVQKMGISLKKAASYLSSFNGVPGRFETFSHPAGATFIVDYAHTEDAIEYCYQTAERENAERIIHILGFRGKRDLSKRRDIVALCSDVCSQLILTFDDLNGVPSDRMVEELQELNEDFADGSAEIIPDRTKAIQHAWEKAENGDWVFITGKGQETYKQSFKLPASTDIQTIQFLKTSKDMVTS